MAIALVVLSTEKGKETATVIAPSLEDFNEARRAASCRDGGYFASPLSEAGMSLWARALDVAARRAGQDPKAKGKGQPALKVK